MTAVAVVCSVASNNSQMGAESHGGATGRQGGRRHRGIQGHRRGDRPHLAQAGASVVVNYSSSRDGAEKVVAAINKRAARRSPSGRTSPRRTRSPNCSTRRSGVRPRSTSSSTTRGSMTSPRWREITEEHFHKQFDLNVLGLILATQKAAEHFGPEGGSIINISSVASTNPIANGRGVLGHQGGGRRRHQGAGQGTGPAQDPGQLDQPRPRPDRGNLRVLRRRDGSSPLLPRHPLGDSVSPTTSPAL